MKSLDEEWCIESSNSVPEDVFEHTKAEGASVTFTKSPVAVGLADKNFHAREVADRIR